MRVFVTGCAGFIGSTLTEYLLQQGVFVLGLDNFNDFYAPEIKRQNIQKSCAHANFVLAEDDLLEFNEDLLFKHSIDTVVHLAAYPGVRPSFDRPMLYHKTNLSATLRLLNIMNSAGITNGVFAGSSSVYGNNPQIPFVETALVEPISIYGATKLGLEGYSRTYARAYNMNITCLRFFTCYGPRQRPDLAIHKFARLLRDGKPITMYGDGSTSRDYTYIDDIVKGIYLAAQRVNGFNIINLGNSYPITLADMIKTISDKLGVTPNIIQEEIPAGDVIQTWASISNAEKMLGWKPEVSFEEGITKFLEWFEK